MSDMVLKLIERFRNISLSAVFVFSAALLLLGLVLSILIVIVTYRFESLGEFDFCLASSCIDFWLEKNSAALSVLSVTGTIVIGAVTIGGISIALLSYQNSVNYSTVSNHLSHLNIFMAYVASESARRSRLCKSDIESLKWYNLIYSESASGKLTVSAEYCHFIDKLNAIISDSNQKYVNVSPVASENYRYKEHQKLMILALKDLGIYLEGLPRIDFNEVEGQVVNLIETVNKSFCRDEAIPAIYSRGYH